MRNVQPLFAELAEGGFAVAHNGNLSNAMTLRAAPLYGRHTPSRIRAPTC
jgi:glutamine phosphoribosylpyrophosphate amidotransferase